MPLQDSADSCTFKQQKLIKHILNKKVEVNIKLKIKAVLKYVLMVVLMLSDGKENYTPEHFLQILSSVQMLNVI